LCIRPLYHDDAKGARPRGNPFGRVARVRGIMLDGAAREWRVRRAGQLTVHYPAIMAGLLNGGSAMRVCYLPPKVIGERLKEDQCSVHGASLPADVIDAESAE